MIQDFFEIFYKMNKTKVTDEFGGNGFKLTQGQSIMAAATTDNRTETRIAEKRDDVTFYAISINKGDDLPYNSIIKRARDGKLFRITSEGVDMETPIMSSMDFKQLNAELYRER